MEAFQRDRDANETESSRSDEMNRQSGPSSSSPPVHRRDVLNLRAEILNLQGVPLFPPDVYRLKDGNQVMTDTLPSKLADRARLNAPLSGIERAEEGVCVTFPEPGREKKNGKRLPGLLHVSGYAPDYPGQNGLARIKGLRDQSRRSLFGGAACASNENTVPVKRRPQHQLGNTGPQHGTALANC